jgi:Ca2+/Na+ antiporter
MSDVDRYRVNAAHLGTTTIALIAVFISAMVISSLAATVPDIIYSAVFSAAIGAFLFALIGGAKQLEKNIDEIAERIGEESPVNGMVLVSLVKIFAVFLSVDAAVSVAGLI